MNICIVGGGHIGITLLCYIKHTYPGYRVSLFTRKPEHFAETIKCNDIEGRFSYDVKPDCVSNDANAAVGGADIVFIALPHFAVEKAFSDIAPFVSERAMIGVLPGGGGCEFFLWEVFRPQQDFVWLSASAVHSQGAGIRQGNELEELETL